MGINGEPGSVTAGNLVAQNLLYLAYNEPVTKTDLAHAIGMPLVYIEPIIEKLLRNELMNQIGSRVYTDFIIYTIEDREKYIPAQKQLVADNYELFLRGIQRGLDELRRNVYYTHATEDQRNSLEMFLVMSSVQKGIYDAFSEIFSTTECLPDRPNGGKWIAFGHVIPQNYNFRDHLDLCMHDYSGERCSYVENFLGATLELFAYDPAFPIKIYYYGKNGIGGVHDEDLLKLLYLIECDINPEKIGFNDKLLQSIPWLTECKILRNDNGKAKINVPVLSKKEKNEVWEILGKTQQEFKNDIIHLLAAFLKDKKQVIPKHLTSVPLYRQYMYSMYAFPMAVLRCTMSKGLLQDSGYDHELQCLYPMIFVMDR